MSSTVPSTRMETWNVALPDPVELALDTPLPESTDNSDLETTLTSELGLGISHGEHITTPTLAKDGYVQNHLSNQYIYRLLMLDDMNRTRHKRVRWEDKGASPKKRRRLTEEVDRLLQDDSPDSFSDSDILKLCTVAMAELEAGNKEKDAEIARLRKENADLRKEKNEQGERTLSLARNYVHVRGEELEALGRKLQLVASRALVQD